MKKLISIIMCVLVLGALVFSASAADSSAALEASTKTVDRGEEFTVVAQLTNTDSIDLCTVALSYDDSVFKLVGGTCTVDEAKTMIGVVKVEQNAGTLMLKSAEALSGAVFTFKFEVKSDARYGESTITPTVSIGNKTGNEIAATGVTVTIACKHSYGGAVKVDDENHAQTCTKCQETMKEPHDWNDGVVQPKPSCEQPGEVLLTCLHCQAQVTKPVPANGHKWDDSCDTDCNTCGQVREVTHSYSEVWSKDASGHWYACSICGDKKDFAAHELIPDTANASAKICSICNYTTAQTHVHQMSTEWITNEDEHWHRCQATSPSCSYVEDREIHDYDNSCDVDCNTCGYIRLAPPHNYDESWQGNASGHWHICWDCFASSEIQPHTPGPAATETDPQRCTECNIVLQMPSSHEHTWGGPWYSDNEMHWKQCQSAECIETAQIEPHQWDAGEELDGGDKRYTCLVCGKQVVTAGEEPPTAPSTVPSTQPPTTPQGGDVSTGKGGFPWQWIGIAAIALLAIGIILLIVEFIRSRKTNSHGKYSK